MNEAGAIAANSQIEPDIRARAALMVLVAAQDWWSRADNNRRRELDNIVIKPLEKWFEIHTEEVGETTILEVEMERIKRKIREADTRQIETFKYDILMRNASTQNAVLLARLARETGDREMMTTAVEMQKKYNDPARLDVLKRWQTEMGSRTARVRENIMKVIYGKALGVIPIGLLVSQDFNKLN